MLKRAITRVLGDSQPSQRTILSKPVLLFVEEGQRAESSESFEMSVDILVEAYLTTLEYIAGSDGHSQENEDDQVGTRAAFRFRIGPIMLSKCLS